MNDLIMGGCLIAGSLACAGLTIAAWRRMPAYNVRREELRRMTVVELHVELMRCTGAIIVCMRRGNRRGARHAHRQMRMVMAALAKKNDPPAWPRRRIDRGVGMGNTTSVFYHKRGVNASER